MPSWECRTSSLGRPHPNRSRARHGHKERYATALNRYLAMATLRSDTNTVKRAASSPALRLLERLGYVTRGALYTVMGVLALGIALRAGGGQATDLSGS